MEFTEKEIIEQVKDYREYIKSIQTHGDKVFNSETFEYRRVHELDSECGSLWRMINDSALPHIDYDTFDLPCDLDEFETEEEANEAKWNWFSNCEDLLNALEKWFSLPEIVEITAEEKPEDETPEALNNALHDFFESCLRTGHYDRKENAKYFCRENDMMNRYEEVLQILEEIEEE